MSIDIRCSKCDQWLNIPGAIVLSPPTENYAEKVWKFHICITCWIKLEKWIKKP